jgi:hypothetical protein
MIIAQMIRPLVVFRNPIVVAISTTKCDPFYGQTSVPGTPKFLKADPNLDGEQFWHNKV